MGRIGVCHSHQLYCEDAVGPGALLVEPGGCEVQILPPNHECLVGLVSGSNLNFPQPFYEGGAAPIISELQRRPLHLFPLFLALGHFPQKIVNVLVVDLGERNPDSVGDVVVLHLQLGGLPVPTLQAGKQTAQLTEVQPLPSSVHATGHTAGGAGPTAGRHGTDVGTLSTPHLEQL